MGSAFLFPPVLEVQLPGLNRGVAGQEIPSMALLKDLCLKEQTLSRAGLTAVWGI